MKSKIIDKTLEFHASIKRLNLEMFKSTAKRLVREQEETVGTESVS